MDRAPNKDEPQQATKKVHEFGVRATDDDADADLRAGQKAKLDFVAKTSRRGHV